MKYLITGVAGFIGFHLARKLLSHGVKVIGLDSINDYYDPKLKLSRLEILNDNIDFNFYKCDISDFNSLNTIFSKHDLDTVVHLAAQAGVRYSLDNPHAYGQSNLVGHLNVLECCRHNNIAHLIYASSSSVYGLNKKTPFSTTDNVDNPVSLYAATKKANELMAHSYSHLYDVATTGLRFFTVYGPWGRPDMALFKFTRSILDGEPIDIYNHGQLSRDFTYIDDIVDGIFSVLSATPTESGGGVPYSVYNIGNGRPVRLLDFVNEIEKTLGVSAIRNYLDMQPGDVEITYSDTSQFESTFGVVPKVGLSEGVAKFVSWYKDYYQV